MNTCPYHKLRPELPPLIPNIAKLPVDERGYPVPWFVSWMDGKPEFRAADARKWDLAIAQRLCWVCGERIKGPKAFVIGPMCAINCNTAEPPSHIECAEWSVKGCPFLVKPQMERRQSHREFEAHGETVGLPIDRNPGACCIWVTNAYKVYRDPRGGKLIRLGWPPIYVTWWAQGRAATRAEVDHSIQTGLPLLRRLCSRQAELDELDRRKRRVYELLPTE